MLIFIALSLHVYIERNRGKVTHKADCVYTIDPCSIVLFSAFLNCCWWRSVHWYCNVPLQLLLSLISLLLVTWLLYCFHLMSLLLLLLMLLLPLMLSLLLLLLLFLFCCCYHCYCCCYCCFCCCWSYYNWCCYCGCY